MAEHQTIDYIKSVIEQVLERIGVQARVEYEDSLSGGLIFNVSSRDAKLLIGHQGASLHALEHVIHSMVARTFSAQGVERTFFSLDIDGYKKNRQLQIKQMVKDAIQEMKRSGNPTSLPPMTNYERRFVHTYITEQFPHVATESSGVDPNRYIKLSI